MKKFFKLSKTCCNDIFFPKASKRISELATPKRRIISKQDEIDRNNSNDKSSQGKSEIKKISLITPLSKVLQSYLDRVYKGPFKN